MRFLITLLFAFVATAAAFPELHLLETRKNKNGTSNGGNSVKKQCRQMASLEQLTALAANQTKLDALAAKGRMSNETIAALKSKAANATTTLDTLKANTTLVDECAGIAANQKVKLQCRAMKQLSKQAAFANNQTAMDAFASKKNLSDAQLTKFKDQISKAQTKLQEMQSNTTLTDLCAAQTKNKGQSGTGTTNAQAAKESGSTATGAASGLTLRALPYVFAPALAAVFAGLL